MNILSETGANILSLVAIGTAIGAADKIHALGWRTAALIGAFGLVKLLYVERWSRYR